jgi:hypothetical protein
MIQANFAQNILYPMNVLIIRRTLYFDEKQLEKS